MARVTVIIPYYQVEPGLLRRAVDSIAAQTLDEPVDVIVVDDASPHPAAEELSAGCEVDRIGLRILQQPNGGPGAARNRGLQAVSGTSEYVAFLDSDDWWEPEHLSRALAALDGGADLYFADCHFQEDDKLLMSGLWQRFGDRCQPVDHAPDQWTTDPDTLQMLILCGYVHTPTVAFRHARWPDMRFPLEYFRFGEDQAFWLALAQAGAKPGFSSRVEAYGGRGVNIYANAAWGTEKQFGITLHEIRFRRAALAVMQLCPEARAFLASLLAEARRSLARQCLHHARRGRLGLCWRALVEEPRLAWLLPRQLMARVIPPRDQSP